VNPWAAGIASFVAFTAGGLFPLLTMLLAPDGARIPATFAIVILALGVTGFVSARLGHAKRRVGVLRNTVGGALAMAITYGIGSLVGTAV
jgi:VIT1/CCC1 family predicted Fe2+/Mn2+ transporter